MRRILSVLVAVALGTSVLTAQEFTIKFATVAPEGSTWMKVMREFDAAVRKESGGRVGFRIYAGQVQGDEQAVLRKIRIGQLHAGGFTGVGMGEIAPKVRILDTPFLVNSYAEVDHLYETFDAEFRAAFEEGGFVLLGWAEVGFVYVFTSLRVQQPEDLQKLKMWTWEGDPVAETAFRTLDLKPIPVAITDVMTSLQTGLIDAFYTSPLAAVALQWFTRVRYMIEVPLADAAGAVLLSKKFFDRMPPDLQEILVRNGRTYMQKLTQLSRQDNRNSIEILRKEGIEIIKVADKDVQRYIAAGERARRLLAGRLYSEEFLLRVERSLRDFRSNGGFGK
jgi:TRAP-type C4-dicarboxylate transport system substrate-binding protein